MYVLLIIEVRTLKSRATIVECNEVILKDDPKVAFQILKTLYSVYQKLDSHVYHWHDKLKVITINFCDWACKNQAYLHKIHMFRKLHLSWSLFVVKTFCKFYLLSK